LICLTYTYYYTKVLEEVKSFWTNERGARRHPRSIKQIVLLFLSLLL